MAANEEDGPPETPTDAIGLNEQEFRKTVRSRFTEIEIDLILEIISQVPVAIWAASGENRNFAVQLWSPGAERLYNFSKADMIGTNYIDKFVNKLERPQAIADHNKLEHTQGPYRNLARDHRADKTTRLMLTQGIALWHPVLREYLQGEVTVDATEVPTKDRNWLEQVLTPESVRVLLDKFTEMTQAAFVSLEDVAKVASSLTKVFLGETAECLIYIEDRGGKLSRIGANGGEVLCEFDPEAVVRWCMTAGEASRIVDYIEQQVPPRSQAPHAVRFPDRVREMPAGAPFAVGTIRDEAETPHGGIFIYLAPGESFSKLTDGFLAAIGGTVNLAVAIEHRKKQMEQEERVIAKEREGQAIARLARQYSHAVLKKARLLQFHADMLLESSTAKRNKEIANALRAMAKNIEDTGKDLETTPHPERFDLADVLNSVTGAIMLSHPKMKLDRDAFPSVYMTGIRPFIEGAFENLLLNALEAQEYEGHVRVSCVIQRVVGRRGRSINIYVCDKGPGLAPEGIENVRVGRPFSTKGIQRGRGLAIARTSFEECDGTLELLGNRHFPDWKGACFRVTLPIESRRAPKK